MRRILLISMALVATWVSSVPCFGQIMAMGAAVPIIGDVNGDNEVNVADVNQVLYSILIGEYSPRVDVNGDGEVTLADVNVLIHIILTEDPPAPQGPDYVDLGLPSGTLWATRNVGAVSPEDGGDYFAWGETEPKEVYDMTTYKWCNGSVRTLTKYCTDSTFGYNGFVDGKTELELMDDAAHVHYRDGRMPSKVQMDELRDYCLWQWTERNGVKGQLVTGPNGNSLFLPAAGYKTGSALKGKGVCGFYWSRDCRSFNSYYPWSLYIDSGEYGYNNTPRGTGFLVRAVLDLPEDGDALHLSRHYLDFGKVPIGETRTDQLFIFNITDEAKTLTVDTHGPFLLKQEENGVSSITVEVPGHSFVPVTVMFTADTPGSYSGYVAFRNPAFVARVSIANVYASAISETEQHECVDLGLPSGTLWAKTNVGASAPEEYGDYFAWGETTPKGNYSWSTYKWCTGSLHALTKYSTDSIYACMGQLDGKTELEPADDAAAVNWGPSWRMPSQEQMAELCELCDWQQTVIHGVNGHLITGPNGNTVFLPMAGMSYRSWFDEVATRGYYWTRTLNSTETFDATCLSFTDSCHLFGYERSYGLTVRPVRASN